MIDDIKEAIESFKNQSGITLTVRDQLGINKINSELDLLKVHEKRPKKKRLPKVNKPR